MQLNLFQNIANEIKKIDVNEFINEIKETFPDKHVYGLIGGFHLFNKSEAEVRRVSEEIRETGIDFICTGHCTKDRAYNIMKKELGDIMWYIAMMCHAFRWNLDEIMEMNIDKLKARYPEGFDTDRANNRKNGDV